MKDYFKNLILGLDFEKEFEENEYLKLIKEKNPRERVNLGTCWYPVLIESVNEKPNFTEIEILFETLDKPHQFRKGNSVFIFQEERRISASILKIKEKMMNLILDDEIPDWIYDGKIGIDLGINSNSYNQIKDSLRILENSNIEEVKTLRDVVLGLKENYLIKMDFEKSEKLNEAQNFALENSIKSKYISLIKGPPGTGKTSTIIELTKKILETEKQIFITAPTNFAIDLICEKLESEKIPFLRIGNPSKISDSILKHTLDEKSKFNLVLKKLNEDLEKISNKANKFIRNFDKVARTERKNLRVEMTELKKLIREEEKKFALEKKAEAKVILSTIVSLKNSFLKNEIFSTSILDEASQSLEAYSLAVVSNSKKIIFVGDEKQLPPILKSDKAKSLGQEISLFEKLIDSGNKTIPISELNIQYRMYPNQIEYSNSIFYDSKLISFKKELSPERIQFIDLIGFDSEEENFSSFQNSKEAEFIFQFIEKNLKNEFITIISPYSAQIDLLTKMNVSEKISIHTIDSFQGREADNIILSLVRSNENFEIGFLSELRRMNVALTRAKEKLTLFGDSLTLSSNPFFENLLEFIKNNGTYLSVWDLESS